MATKALARLKNQEAERPQTEGCEEGERLAHDLKAPLLALKHLVGQQEVSMLPDELKRLLNLAVERLSTLSDSYLQSTRNPAVLDRYSLAGFKAILQETLDECGSMRDLASSATRPEVVFYNFADIQKALESPSLYLRLQKTELKSVLHTLFENAIESLGDRETNPVIKVSCYLDKSFLRLEVQDNGSGICDDILPLITTKYSTYQKPNGNGLGLYFASQTIQRWGGALEIHSKLGRGTTVVVNIPIFEDQVH